jgi:uncharacterized membrane protein
MKPSITEMEYIPIHRKDYSQANIAEWYFIGTLLAICVIGTIINFI